MADPGDTRDPVDTLEALASEFIERQRRGECPSVSEYAEQHPGLAQEIRELFPTIAATERLKAKREQASDGLASLGAVKLDRLGDFRIIREIGRGGMGIVYEAEQESLGRRVAIKVLPRQALLDDRHLRRFRREARIAASLHHTNIVEVFGVGEQEGFHYFVMQYIDGVGLDRVVEQLRDAEGPRDWRGVAHTGRQVADALAYAHAQGTLHRDVKPANLLLDSQGTVWVTDFGLAKAVQSDDVTRPGDIAGTLRYMAPEQFSGETDARSDVYGLGLTLYEMLTLRPAFGDTDRPALIRRIAHERPTAPRGLNPGIPRDLETIVLKAIAREPAHRYPSANALAEDLRCFLEDRPIRARRVSHAERVWRWCRRNPAVAGLAGTALLSLLLVAVVATGGYLRTRRAWRAEASERARAEANAKLAVKALDRIFERFAPDHTVSSAELSVEGVDGGSITLPSSPVLSRDAAALLEEMLAFYDRLADQAGDEATIRRKAAEASRRVGDIRQLLGQHADASQAYHRAISAFRELLRRAPGRADLRAELARTLNALGRMYQSTQRLAEGRQSHLEALAILEPTDSATGDTPEAAYELARTHYFLGTRDLPPPGLRPRRPGQRPSRQRPSRQRPIRRLGPDNTSAREAKKASLAKATALLNGLIQKHPSDPRYRHLLALCTLDGASADAKKDAGPLDQAIEILEYLVKAFPEAPQYRFDLSEAYAKVHVPPPPAPPPRTGRPRRRSTATDAAAERLRKALALSDQLTAKHPYIPQYAASQARIRHKLASLMRQASRLGEAEQSSRKAVTLQAALVRQFPESLTHRVWLAVFQTSLGDVLTRGGKPQEARPLLETAIRCLADLPKDDPALWFVPALKERSERTLARALRQSGDRRAAREAERRAEDLLRSMRRSRGADDEDR